MSGSDLQVRPLGECLGAELVGFDLGAPLTPERADMLRKAFWANPVLVVRGQQLTPERLVEIGRVFGRLEAHSILQYRHPEHAELSYITNVDKDGNVDIFGQEKRAVDWHSDGSFKAQPDSVAFLYSIAAPSRGGATEFCSMYAAYEALPEATRQRLDKLRAFHKRGEGWRCASPPPPLTAEQKASGEFEGAEHPVVITHPHSGRRALYVNPSHCVQIVGMERAASDALLDELLAHATQPQFQYGHAWRVGDILFWDQRCLLHRAGRGTPAGEKRIMIRGMMVDRLSEERLAA
jgi:taurine dioxygenase